MPRARFKLRPLTCKPRSLPLDHNPSCCRHSAFLLCMDSRSTHTVPDLAPHFRTPRPDLQPQVFSALGPQVPWLLSDLPTRVEGRASINKITSLRHLWIASQPGWQSGGLRPVLDLPSSHSHGGLKRQEQQQRPGASYKCRHLKPTELEPAF